MSDLSHVRIDWDGDLAIVTIDRQDKLNALNTDVVRELGEVFTSLGDDAAINGVIVTGAGDKAFVAGADIAELARLDAVSGMELSREGQRVFGQIEAFPKPVLAAVHGYALGGGCELALACHLRVASHEARFGLPEVGLGILPGYGGTVRLARLVGLGRALEMTLTGDMIDADRALAWGLVSRVVAEEDLAAAARDLLRRATRNAPLALRSALESVYGGVDSSLARALAFESSAFGMLAATDDMKEGMEAFLEKRRASFRGR